MTRIRIMRAWEKQEEKRVEPLEELRRTWEVWQDALALQEYRYLIENMEQMGLITTATTPICDNPFYHIFLSEKEAK